MTSLDGHVVSGQDYTTWVNNMVDQGKMRWPDTSPKKQIESRDQEWSVKSVACGFIGGTHDSYAIGEQKFCGLIRQYIGATLWGGSWILQEGLCDDNESCTMIIDIAFTIGGAFVSDAIPAFCESIFEAIWNDCNGTGGSAQLTVGAETGTVQAQFFTQDEGAVCPATTDTNVCQSSTF